MNNSIYSKTMYDVGFPHLGIYIENLRNSITIGGFSIAFYGMIIGLAIIIGLILTCKEARRTGQNENDYTDFIKWGIIGAVVGLRLYYVAFQWDYYSVHPEMILDIRSGGLAIYGGIIGGILALIIWCAIRKKNSIVMMDTYAPQMILGQAMGRWGNFFNMEAFGGYTDSLFAMQLKLEKVSIDILNEDVLSHVMNIGGTDYIQVHPTFLYESFWCLLIFIFLLYIQRRKTFDGQILCLYVGLYGFERMIVEGLRTDSLMLWGTDIKK